MTRLSPTHPAVGSATGPEAAAHLIISREPAMGRSLTAGRGRAMGAGRERSSRAAPQVSWLALAMVLLTGCPDREETKAQQPSPATEPPVAQEPAEPRPWFEGEWQGHAQLPATMPPRWAEARDRGRPLDEPPPEAPPLELTVRLTIDGDQFISGTFEGKAGIGDGHQELAGQVRGSFHEEGLRLTFSDRALGPRGMLVAERRDEGFSGQARLSTGDGWPVWRGALSLSSRSSGVGLGKQEPHP